MNVTKLENSPDSTLFEQFSIVRQRKLQLRDSITVYQVKTNQVFMPNIDLKKIFRYKTFGDACCRSGSPVWSLHFAIKCQCLQNKLRQPSSEKNRSEALRKKLKSDANQNRLFGSVFTFTAVSIKVTITRTFAWNN